MAFDIIVSLIEIGIVLSVLLSLAAVLSWAERKQSAVLQDRIGPNRASILGLRLFGLFHPVADAIKMFFKEDFIPARGNRFLHTIAPFIAMMPALLTFAVIPFGDVLEIGGRKIPLQIADPNIGILFVFSIASLIVYGVILAGYSSYNNYAMLGAMRACAQMISYEVTLGLSIIGVLIVFNSVRLGEIVRMQGGVIWGVIPGWGIIYQPFAFILFLTAAIAETKRVPFDLPEGESEIQVGYFIEYSGMKWGMFFLAEFVEIVVVSALITTLFFGGWQFPYLLRDGFHIPGGIYIPVNHYIVSILQVLSFGFKVVFFCWLQLMIRWTLPRFRFDQLMALCWKGLLPLSLLNIFVTAAVILVRG